MTGWWPSTPPRPPAASAGTRPRSTATTSHPRSASAPTAGCGSRPALAAAVDRIEEIAATDRWRPASIDLGIALDNSRKNQTYNTPALATVFLAVHQIDWFNANGGLEWAAGRSDAMAATLYGWAEAAEYATPYVTDPALRSSIVGTIDLDDSVAADDVIAACAANGILDIGGYRKLGRNQLRISMFPGVEHADIEALTSSLDYVVGELAG